MVDEFRPLDTDRRRPPRPRPALERGYKRQGVRQDPSLLAGREPRRQRSVVDFSRDGEAIVLGWGK